MDQSFIDSVHSIRMQTQSTLNDLLHTVVYITSKLKDEESITEEDIEILSIAIESAKEKAKMIGLEFINEES